jgi:preprotein translocase subunit YajC
MDISLLFPLLILLLFIPIFLSGRRQRRQVQEMQRLQASLEPGDVVMTTSGLRGTVVDASYEDTIDIEIADGVVTTWVRGAVREKVNPTAAAGADDAVTSDEPAAPVETETDEAPSLDKAPTLDKAPSLEKGESANGTPRS